MHLLRAIRSSLLLGDAEELLFENMVLFNALSFAPSLGAVDAERGAYP